MKAFTVIHTDDEGLTVPDNKKSLFIEEANVQELIDILYNHDTSKIIAITVNRKETK